MASVVLSTPGNAIMQRCLIQVNYPHNLADLAATNDLWLFRPEAAYSEIVAGGIQKIKNLKTTAAYVAAATSGRRPVFVTDETLGVPVAEFNADRQRELVRALPVDYSTAWTMMVVSKQAAANAANSMTMGFFGTAPATAWIGRNTTGGLVGNLGTGGSTAIPNDGAWTATWLTHDPVTKTIKLRTGTNDWVSDTYTTVTSATSLRFGQTAAQGFEGRIGMGWFASVDVSDPANDAVFSVARSTVDRLFGQRVDV